MRLFVAAVAFMATLISLAGLTNAGVVNRAASVWGAAWGVWDSADVSSNGVHTATPAKATNKASACSGVRRRISYVSCQ